VVRWEWREKVISGMKVVGIAADGGVWRCDNEWLWLGATSEALWKCDSGSIARSNLDK